MRIKLYNDKPFVVTIDRNRFERRYVLETVEKDGSWTPQCEPLFSVEFRERFGFSEEWPHKVIKEEECANKKR